MSVPDFSTYFEASKPSHFGEFPKIENGDLPNPEVFFEHEFLVNGGIERTSTDLSAFFERLGVSDGFFTNYSYTMPNNPGVGTPMLYEGLSQTSGLSAFGENLNIFDILALDDPVLTVELDPNSLFYQIQGEDNIPTMDEILGFYASLPPELRNSDAPLTQSQIEELFQGDIPLLGVNKMAMFFFSLFNTTANQIVNPLAMASAIGQRWGQISSFERMLDTGSRIEKVAEVNGQDVTYVPMFTLHHVPVPQEELVNLYEKSFATFVKNYRSLGESPPTPFNFSKAYFEYLQSGLSIDEDVDIGVNLKMPNGFVYRLGEQDPLPLKSGSLPGFTFIPGGTSDSFVDNVQKDPTNGLETMFAQAMRETTDWAGIDVPESLLSDPLDPSSLDLSQVQDDSFASYVNYLIDSGQSIDARSLFQNVSQMYGPVVLLQDDEEGTSANLHSYESIYRAFYPNDDSGFLPRLATFIETYTSDPDKTFTPSLMMENWVNTIMFEALNVSVEEIQPLLQTRFEQVEILLRLYDLIVAILAEMHKLTAAQTERQRFLTEYQALFTDLQKILIEEVPKKLNQIFEGYDQSISEEAAAIAVRGDVNNLIAQYNDNLNAFRSEVSNSAREQQTTVQNSQESLSQQLNILGAILQQMQSLLQAIWR